MVRGITIFLLLTVAIGVLFTTKPLLRSEIYNILEDNTVDFIDDYGDVHATGFFINNEGDILTAAHVTDRYSLVSYKGKTYKVVFKQSVRQHDVAVAHIEIPKERAPDGLKLNFKEPGVGSKIYKLGNAGGLLHLFSAGFVGGYVNFGVFSDDSRSMNIDLNGNPGDSGSAIVNDRGEVVGILSFGNSGYINLTFASVIAHVDSFCHIAKETCND